MSNKSVPVIPCMTAALNSIPSSPFILSTTTITTKTNSQNFFQTHGGKNECMWLVFDYVEWKHANSLQERKHLGRFSLHTQ